MIIRERLRFPSGFSTAVLISVLHGQSTQSTTQDLDAAAKGGFASLVPREETPTSDECPITTTESCHAHEGNTFETDWVSNMRLLLLSFLASGLFTISTYFFPFMRNIPIFGNSAAQTWLWTLNPSLAYVGQGIIMGAETTMHMTLGAVIGWGILSPLAKFNGWAPGHVNDWDQGSKGWIVWVSLAIMLVDAIVSLAYVALGPLLRGPAARILHAFQIRCESSRLASMLMGTSVHYSPLQTEDDSSYIPPDSFDTNSDCLAQEDGEDDAPVEQQIGMKTVILGLFSSILLCIATIQYVFGNMVPLLATVIAVVMALILSIIALQVIYTGSNFIRRWSHHQLWPDQIIEFVLRKGLHFHRTLF